MKALAGVVATALFATLLVHPAASAATPSARRPVAAGARTLKIDVDGDRRKDTVRFTMLDATRYRVKVTTAKPKRTVTRTVTVAASDATPTWYGAGRLDGAKGVELIVGTGGMEEAIWFDVLTWRRGRLVLETAPKAPAGVGWGFYGTGDSWSGYYFFTSKKRRYVDAADLHGSGSLDSEGRYKKVKATIIRSVWKSGKWRTVSKRKVTTTGAKASKYDDFGGVAITR